MIKKNVIVTLMLCFMSLGGFSSVDKKILKKAKELNQKIIVLDSHSHPISEFHRIGNEVLKLDIKSQYSMVDYESMCKGGVDGSFITVPFFFLNQKGQTELELLTKSLSSLKSILNKSKDKTEIATSSRDLKRIIKKGKKAYFLNVEFWDFYGGKTAILDVLYQEGIRMITLFEGRREKLATLIKKDSKEQLLTKFGQEVITRMNKLGIAVDITHCSDSLQLDIITKSTAPVLITHSCTRAVNDLKRNASDKVIKALAAGGGAIMTNFSGGMIDSEYLKNGRELIKKYYAKRTELAKKYSDNIDKIINELIPYWKSLQGKRVPVERLINHIEHVVKLVGIDHIGIGTDYLGPREFTPEGLGTYAGFPLITYHLLKRGYSEKDIAKIMGGNLLRVLEKVEASAKK